ncbi:uncharacterized protein LOC143446244 [Clavelina lepadiformis]|uniref:uncharacterized protein LOC143446244 n=1 Tax=Clavelina lepadiformis TaxID=159417 RepID=UPI0040413FB2
MKVICSGMSKTGTKTLASALKTLGYNVYDFEEQVFYIGRDLQKVMDEGWTVEDLRRIYKGVDAVTDIPGCILWEELYHAFPDAKVIHTERASEEEWVRSQQKQIDAAVEHKSTRWLMQLSSTGRQAGNFVNAAYRLQVSTQRFSPFYKTPFNAQFAKLRYREHNANVRAVASSDRILYFKFKDGWDPLCKFLGVPQPNKPFPHRNKGGEIAGEIIEKSLLFEQIRKELFVTLPLLGAFLCAFLYYACIVFGLIK